MAKNSNLHNAKAAKNDDFFTQLSDIENELQHYWSHGVNHFEGKSVLMNCDNPKFSNFWVYFHKRFKQLGLKKLTAIHYSVTEPAYVKVYNGGDDFDISVGDITYLKGNGDFRSEECINILKGVDMVVTNPPFSLYREFVAQLVKYNKQFILWANNNSITYKEIFPLIKENKMWLGVTCNKTLVFGLSDDYTKFDEKETNKRNDGHKYGKVPAISVFTNIDLQRRHDYMVLSKEYTPEAYPKYDNYDAINVDKVNDIPMDYFECFIVPDSYLSNLDDTFTIYEDAYEMLEAIKNDEIETDYIALNTNGEIKIPINKNNKVKLKALVDKLEKIGVDLEKAIYRTGVIGVPITFLGKHCPEQFEIIGCADADIIPDDWGGMTQEFVELYYEQGNTGSYKMGNRLSCYVDNKGKAKVPYKRILIRAVIKDDKKQNADKLSNDLMKILSVPGAIKQELTHLRVTEDE